MHISVIYNSVYSQLFNQNASNNSMLILLCYFQSPKCAWPPFLFWISVQKIPVSRLIQSSVLLNQLQKIHTLLTLPFLLFPAFFLFRGTLVHIK